MLDGGAGVDTAVFSGARGDYMFSFVGGQLTIHDDTEGLPDGTDTLIGIETLVFQGGATKPIGAIEGTYATNTLTATAAHDSFLFDTATGLPLGSDAIKGFGAGDRVVTTSALFDDNKDGKIKANASDRFVLPSTFDHPYDSTGTLKLLNAAGKPITNLVPEGMQVDHGVTDYVYGALGDTAVDHTLLF